VTRADTAPIHACNLSAGTPAGLPHLCRTAGFAQLPAEPYQRVQQIVPLALVSHLTLTDTVVVNARIDMIDHDAREVTLVDAGGGTATVRFGPEIDASIGSKSATR
jgi:hypothetical protein